MTRIRLRLLQRLQGGGRVSGLGEHWFKALSGLLVALGLLVAALPSPARAETDITYTIDESALRSLARDHVNGVADGWGKGIASANCIFDSLEELFSFESAVHDYAETVDSLTSNLGHKRAVARQVVAMMKAARRGDKAALSKAARAVSSGIKVGKLMATIAEALAIDIVKLGARVVFGRTSDGCDVLKAHAGMADNVIGLANRYHPGPPPNRYFATFNLNFHTHNRRFSFDNCIWEESVEVFSREHLSTAPPVSSAYFEITLPGGCSRSLAAKPDDPQDQVEEISGDHDGDPPPGGGGEQGGGGGDPGGGGDGGNGPAPDTTITAGPPSTTTNDFATVYFLSSPAGASFQCRFDSSDWVPCTNPKRYSQVAVGQHTAYVRAVANGVADPSPATHTWTRVPPDTEITAAPSGSVTRHTATIYFKSNETTDTNFECSIDGAAWVACANPKSYSSLGVGSHTFRVRAVVLGAEDPTPAAATWTVVPPDTEITAGPHSSSSSTATVYFRSQNDPDATFQCKFDSNAWVACTNPKGYSSIQTGQHTVYVRAVDEGAEDPTPASIAWTRT